MKLSMKILLINLHSSRNAGDHVLLEVALQQLRTTFPGCAITLAMNDPASYARRANAGDEQVVDSFFAWFKRPATSKRGGWRRLTLLWSLAMSLVAALLYRLLWLRADWIAPAAQRPIVRSYLEADLVASCAGNYLYSRGHAAGLPLLGPLFALFYAWLAGKPLVLLPQTIGPLWRRWERLLVRWMLMRAQVVLLRDATSVELMARMKVPPARYHLTPDIAFLYTIDDPAPGDGLLAKYGVDPARARPLLGVTLIDWSAQHPRFKGQARYEAAVAAAIRHFVETRGGTALLFAQVCGPNRADDDRVPARRVRALLDAPHLAGRIIVVDEEVRAATLKAAYGRMDLFLGSRLHSNIFALTEHVPVLAIAYQDKTFGVLRMLGLGEWAIRIEAVDDAQLITKIQQLWEERTQLRRQIKANVASLQAEASQALHRVEIGGRRAHP